MKWLTVYLLAAVTALGPGALALGQLDLGESSDELGGSPLAGLEGDFDATEPVTISAEFTAPTADQPAALLIRAEIASGWHVYSLTQPPGGPSKTKIDVVPSSQYRLASEFRSWPAPTKTVDKQVWVGLTIEEHEGQVVWYAPIKLAEGVDPASLTIDGKVQMLACKQSCVPVTKSFSAREGAIADFGLRMADLDLSMVPSSPSAVADPPLAAASFQPEGSEVKISGRLSPGVTRPGAKAQLEITLIPPPHWHIYAYADRDEHAGSKPTLIAFDSLSGLRAAPPETSAAIVTDDSVPEFGTMRYHEGAVTWIVPITVPANAQLGDYRITGVIGYQACESKPDGGGSCELPKGVKFATTLIVGDVPGSISHPLEFIPTTYKEVATVAANWAPAWDGDAKAAVSTASGAEMRRQGREYDLARIDIQQTRRSLGYYIVLAFVGGIILNLMPCVLPVIGLKVMSFVEQAHHSRTHALVLNLWYSAGIVSVFLLLGFLAAWIGLSWGGQFGSTAFAVTLAAIVFAMALSLLGVWEIPIPGFFGSGAVQDVAAKEGPFGAFLKGAITTVLATPCTGPFMASAIAWAVTQSMSTTLVVFGSLGLGMASPYLLVGVFPELLRFLPKPGVWMETFKQITGLHPVGHGRVHPFVHGPDGNRADARAVVGRWSRLLVCFPHAALGRVHRPTASWAVAGAVVLFADRWRLRLALFDRPRSRLAAILAGEAATGRRRRGPHRAGRLLGRLVHHLQSARESRAAHRPRSESDCQLGRVRRCTATIPTTHQRSSARSALKSNGVPVIAIFPGDRPYEPIVFRDGYTAGGLIAALKQAGAGRGRQSTEAVATAAQAIN